MNFFFLRKFKVHEESMIPLYYPGDTVLASPIPYLLTKPKITDRIVFLEDNKYMIKRIEKIVNRTYFVIGANRDNSIDSRTFGWIKHGQIIGKVIAKV